MLNAADTVVSLPSVIDYDNPVVAERMSAGKINTDASVILANIQSSIRRGHPQMQQGPLRPERVCLVGSGPSLHQTEAELRQLLWEGAILVTMNGAYHWCIERNLRPQTQIVMDARPSNARFVQPPVPKCNYVLASQCAPELWDAVEGREHVFIFHAVVKGKEDAGPMLDQFYKGQWMGVGGGTTVATRAISLLRLTGYVRFSLFGIDCCWAGDQHHALPQPENDQDTRLQFRVGPTGRPEQARVFQCSYAHVKQLEDFLTILHINGKHFALDVHGDGVLAHVIKTLGAGDTIETATEAEGPCGDDAA